MTSEKNTATEFNVNTGVDIWHEGFSHDDYKQTLVKYAYKLGGYDFVAVLECENGNWNYKAIGDSGHAFGLCQMNDRYHKDFPKDYKTNPIVQVEYCYQKWSKGTVYYGPQRLVKGKKCYEFVKDRFTFIE